MITCPAEATPMARLIGTGCRNRHLQAVMAPLMGNSALKSAGNCAFSQSSTLWKWSVDELFAFIGLL